MNDIVSLIKNTPPHGCATLNRLNDWHGEHLEQIGQFFHEHGFHELEYLGSGSNAVVVAPKDNANIVMRIDAFTGDSRCRAQPMLQTIGEPARIGAVMEDGVLKGGYKVEFLKRLDMNVAKEDLNQFLQQLQPHGYKADSLARGSEIGWYNYESKGATEAKRVLMGADPSALSRAKGEQKLIQNYPTLREQYVQNLKIASNDSRLEFLQKDIHKHLESVPIPTQSVESVAVTAPQEFKIVKENVKTIEKDARALGFKNPYIVVGAVLAAGAAIWIATQKRPQAGSGEKQTSFAQKIQNERIEKLSLDKQRS